MTHNEIIKSVWANKRLAPLADAIVDKYIYGMEGTDNLQEMLDVLDAAKDKLTFLRTKNPDEAYSLRA